MNRRTRSRFTANDGYLRYLKPGALAQLRDSKINSRTHHRPSDSQIHLPRAISSSSPVSSSPPRSPTASGSVQHQEPTGNTIAAVDGGSPCFSARLYGPRCIQRKKLMAARSMFCVSPTSTSPTSDSPEPVIDAFANGFLVAH